jgi:putative colanic acid biosynthesis UDP-glucose lipid carrier transferase
MIMDRIFTKEIKQEIIPHYAPILTDSSKLLMKRIFDLAVAIVSLLLICSWLFPLVAIAIKLSSKGPVIFKQLRHGKDNAPFYCYKFRTMVVNNNAYIQQASRHDRRITKVGRLLRKTSIDELPQIINVIRGEMSIVGPRPHAVPMNEIFSKEINNFMFRHAVKPGITGLAQSKGFRGETLNFFDLHCRYRLDMFYIKKWCLYFDSIIILKTMYTLWIKNDKAY